ncbi:gamma-aminobutyric acid type B receptor subunit 2 [Ixodes scapularis]
MNNADADAVVASSGVRVEFNTRRFAIDERRELFYRTEVQSRAYAREVNELDLEIARLKKLLGEPTSTEASSDANSAKSESPLSSLLERFKRKRASLESEGISAITTAGATTAFSSPGPPPHRFRNPYSPHPAKIHSVIHAGIPESPLSIPSTRTLLQLRAEDLLPKRPEGRSPRGLPRLRSSLPAIAALDNASDPDDPLSRMAMGHAGSFPALRSSPSSEGIEDNDEEDGGRDSVYQSVEVVANGGSTTDEYRTVSSDDDTYVSCRTFNRGSSSTLANWSPACFEPAVAGELGVLEEMNDDDSSAATTPVSRNNPSRDNASREETSREASEEDEAQCLQGDTAGSARTFFKTTRSGRVRGRLTTCCGLAARYLVFERTLW